MDANENPQQTNNTGITHIFQETDLHNLHAICQPQQERPPAYNRGLTLIDLCAGSHKFKDALIGAWYLPFGLPHGLKGDHRTLGLDLKSANYSSKQQQHPTKPQHEECIATTSK